MRAGLIVAGEEQALSRWLKRAATPLCQRMAKLETRILEMQNASTKAEVCRARRRPNRSLGHRR